MWPEFLGEEIYHDNLGDLTIDQSFDTGLETIYDVDQFFSSDDETEADKLTYIAVGIFNSNPSWSVIEINWAPEIGRASCRERV